MSVGNDRLSELKQQETEAAVVEGEKIGIEWAENTAGWGQLERLKDLVSDPYGNDFMLYLDFEGQSWGGPHNALVRRVNGVREDDFDPSMGEEFWEELEVSIAFYKPYIKEFVRAFVEGALSGLKKPKC